MEKSVGYYNILAQRAIHEEEAFVELYEYFFPRVYNFIFSRLKNAAESDDVTSIVFQKMYENLKNYDSSKAAFSTWLFRIATNAITDRVRRQDSRKETEWADFFDPAAPDTVNPESNLVNDENNKELLAAIASLDEREQRIISLKYWSDLSNKEIADVLGISYSNVSTILNRALKRLRKHYGDNDDMIPEGMN